MTSQRQTRQAAHDADRPTGRDVTSAAPDAGQIAGAPLSLALQGILPSGRGSAAQRAAVVQQLQRTMGNRATRRLLQRQTAGPPAPVPVQRTLWTGEQLAREAQVRGLRLSALLNQIMNGLDWYHAMRTGKEEGDTNKQIYALEQVYNQTRHWLALKQANKKRRLYTALTELRDLVEAELEGLYAQLKKEEAKPDDNDFPTTSNNPLVIKTLDSLFPSGGQPTVADIIQGDIGDCFFLAVVIDAVQKNPDFVKSLFKLDKPWNVRTNTPAQVSVQFWRKDKIGSFTAEWVQVPALPGAKSVESGSKPWIIVMERAYATWKGSYQAINSGYSNAVFDAIYGPGLTEVKAEDHRFVSTKEKQKIDLPYIKQLLKGGYMVIVNTRLSPGGDKDYVKLASGDKISLQHAYAAEAMVGNNLKIRNPHGSKSHGGTGEHVITPEEFKRFFSRVYYAKGNAPAAAPAAASPAPSGTGVAANDSQ